METGTVQPSTTEVKIDITPLVEQQKLTNDYLKQSNDYFFLADILLFGIIVFAMFKLSFKGLWK